MNESSFAMHVVEEAPALRVALSGRLDTITAPEFQAQVLPLVEGASSCIIDCSGLSYLSSAGLRTFLLVHKRLMSSGARLALDGVAPAMREVLDLTGFSGIFDVLG